MVPWGKLCRKRKGKEFNGPFEVKRTNVAENEDYFENRVKKSFS